MKKSDSQYWLDKYDTAEHLDFMVKAINKHRCCSWRYIARWSCDVFTDERDEALPKVLHDLYMKLADVGRIGTFSVKGQRYFCSNEFLEDTIAINGEIIKT